MMWILISYMSSACRASKRAYADARAADCYIRPGRAQTIHAAQGVTSDKVMVHLESFRSNVDARTACVAVSRAKTFTPMIA
jgi:hypothetical protein